MAHPPAPEEPLFFQRIPLGKIWGGERLAGRLGIAQPAEGPLGETWELSDHPGRETKVRGGPLDGVSLRELMEHHAASILGSSRPDPQGRFPLLVKLIEAGDDLSVQVHPPDGPLSPTGIGKTEAWFILEADPGAEVILGLCEGTTQESFEPDAATSAVRRHLHRQPVAPGDCILVAAGTVHAICGGVTLCEVQQTCDVTFRLYDWDRPGPDGRPRETHVEQALRVIDYARGPGGVVRPRPGEGARDLVACPYFRLRLWRGAAPFRLEPCGRARTLTVVAGGGRLGSPSEAFGERALGFGDTVLLPAALAPVEAIPAPGGLELLEGTAL